MGDTERGGKRIAGGANRQQGLSSGTIVDRPLLGLVVGQVVLSILSLNCGAQHNACMSATENISSGPRYPVSIAPLVSCLPSIHSCMDLWFSQSVI